MVPFLYVPGVMGDRALCMIVGLNNHGQFSGVLQGGSLPGDNERNGVLESLHNSPKVNS